MIEIILKGIVVGLFISIPLGPIGMLCIQRTLSKSRLHGIITGLGATTSDLVYTIITLFFLHFVIDFIEIHKSIIQIAGSIIVVGFGIFIYRSNPIIQPKASDKIQNSLLEDYFTSFVLTLSNPIIIFILIALLAKFDFLQEDTSTVHIVSGILSILGGATLWWTSLTYLVSHFKDKLTSIGLRFINIISGLIITIIGIIGLVSSFFS